MFVLTNVLHYYMKKVFKVGMKYNFNNYHETTKRP